MLHEMTLLEKHVTMQFDKNFYMQTDPASQPVIVSQTQPVASHCLSNPASQPVIVSQTQPASQSLSLKPSQ